MQELKSDRQKGRGLWWYYVNDIHFTFPQGLQQQYQFQYERLKKQKPLPSRSQSSEQPIELFKTNWNLRIDEKKSHHPGII